MKEISEIFKRKNQHADLVSLNPQIVEHFLNEALDIVFPGMIRKSFKNEIELQENIDHHSKNLKTIFTMMNSDTSRNDLLVDEYKKHLNLISMAIEEDANALLQGDPAAQDLAEVVLSYPGLYAIATYRVAHFFYSKKILVFPRMLSEIAHTKTGIDIHPGAKIGKSFFIDHGTGVVIGETSLIGDHVKIYQGVTLGAMSVDKSMAHLKRHPTIEDDCIIYAHATILGGETVIGKGSLVGGNVWLTRSIPEDSMVYHRSEIKLDKKKGFN